MNEKPKILLVDDKPENLFALKESLRSIEAEFITATSGNEALKQILSHDFALALIDLQMPEMDGYELAELMRSDKKAQHIPIIFISAIYDDDYHLFKGYDSGAVDFLTKPYHPLILIGKCKVFINLYMQKREIEKSKDYMNNILSSIHEALIVTDPEGVIEKINQATLRFLGYDEDELIGKPLEMVLEAVEKDVPDNRERTLIAKSGRRLPVLFSRSVVQNKNGDRRGIVYVATDISDRKKAEEQIRASLAEKELLLRELYHRTKNNMLVISSLITLQSTYIKDKQILQVFKDLDNRIQSMALVHKNLYKSKNLSQIGLKGYIEDLAYSTLKSYKVIPTQILLKIKAEDDIFVSIDVAIPCGLVINEIISNSLRHAFPGDRVGEIRISLNTTDENEIEICIGDNGISVPGDFDLRKTNSLGAQLITSLVENQLKGKVEMIRGQGTEFQIRFKDPYRGRRG